MSAFPTARGAPPSSARASAGSRSPSACNRRASQTTVYEARDNPGGRAYVYEDEGFTFDAGPTVITAPDALDELWELSGRRRSDYVTFLPVAPFYRLCWEDGTVFDYADDQEQLDEQIAAINPNDVEGYRRFLDYSRELYVEGYEKLGAVPFLNFRQMIAAAPALARLSAHRSVYAKVATFIEDEHLRQAFSFHSLLVGGNPFSTSAIYALIHALERKRGACGSRKGARARWSTACGACSRIWAARSASTRPSRRSRWRTTAPRASSPRAASAWRTTWWRPNGDVGAHLSRPAGCDPPRAQARRQARREAPLDEPVRCLFRAPPRASRAQAPHGAVRRSSYRELVNEIFTGQELAPDFSLYLHCPSVTDSSLAPEGQSAYYVLSPVPHLGQVNVDWETVGPAYRDKILDYLEERYIPGLREDLVTVRHFTPADFKSELRAHHGSAFSVEPILTQSAWFRPHNCDGKIPNVFLVGAGTPSGRGHSGRRRLRQGDGRPDAGAGRRGAGVAGVRGRGGVAVTTDGVPPP